MNWIIKIQENAVQDCLNNMKIKFISYWNTEIELHVSAKFTAKNLAQNAHAWCRLSLSCLSAVLDYLKKNSSI